MPKAKKQKDLPPVTETPKTIDPKMLTFDQRRAFVSQTLINVTPSGFFEMMGIITAIQAELQEQIAKIVRSEVK